MINICYTYYYEFQYYKLRELRLPATAGLVFTGSIGEFHVRQLTDQILGVAL